MMPGLRDILDAATRGDDSARFLPNTGATMVLTNDRMQAQETLRALAPELAALCLDMGEEMRRLATPDYRGPEGDKSVVVYGHKTLGDKFAPLLARLDQLGKEPSDG